MSGRIWLIVEDENDGLAARVILAKKGFQVRVEIRTPTGNSGGISRLSKQITKLIKTIRDDPKFDTNGDCIAVLHDADQHSQTVRTAYEQIAKVCEKERVKLAIAYDELEAWMLADSGLCGWLGIKARNCDEEAKPSDRLRSLLMSNHKLKYQGINRARVVEQLNGDGDVHSQSMQEALDLLKNAPCLKD